MAKLSSIPSHIFIPEFKYWFSFFLTRFLFSSFHAVRDFILSFFLFFATCAFSSKYSEIHRELLSRLLLCLIVFDYVPHMTMIWLLLRLFQKVFFRHKMINVWYMVIGRFVRDLSKSPTLFYLIKKKLFNCTTWIAHMIKKSMINILTDSFKAAMYRIFRKAWRVCLAVL